MVAFVTATADCVFSVGPRMLEAETAVSAHTLAESPTKSLMSRAMGFFLA